MATHFRRLIMNITILIPIVFTAQTYALSPCDTTTVNGITTSYEIKVKENSYKVERDFPLQLPLVNPEVIGQYQVLNLHAIVRTPTQGPLDIGALERAWIAASRQSDPLSESLYRDGPERAKFKQACAHIVNRLREQSDNGRPMRIKALDFGPPKQGIPEGFQEDQSCNIRMPDGKNVIARIFYQKELRKIRRTTETVGQVLVNFDMDVTGRVSKDYKVQTRWRIPNRPLAQPSNLSPDAFRSVVDIKMALHQQHAEEDALRLKTEFGTKRWTLSSDQQSQLCSGESGVAKLLLEINLYGKSEEINITLVSKRDRGPNLALGVSRCDLINCDCPNMNAGILNRGWIPQCRGEQKAARAACEKDGKVHRCHTPGSNPTYPE